MERRLLLLGLLQDQELYGYQMNEMIDTHVGTSLHLPKPTAYRILHKLTEEGLVTFRQEKEGNRPTRRVYAITPKGKREFLESLKWSLSEYIPSEQVSAIGLAFLDRLPQEESISALETRIEKIEEILQPILDQQTKDDNFQLINENQILHLSAELEWLKELIKDLKSN
jgi:DNA-binding PadR family transcriptional regulator